MKENKNIIIFAIIALVIIAGIGVAMFVMKPGNADSLTTRGSNVSKSVVPNDPTGMDSMHSTINTGKILNQAQKAASTQTGSGNYDSGNAAEQSVLDCERANESRDSSLSGINDKKSMVKNSIKLPL